MRGETGESEGPLTYEATFDGVTLEWTEAARGELARVATGVERRRVRAEVEKSARRLGLRTITKACIAPFVRQDEAFPP